MVEKRAHNNRYSYIRVVACVGIVFLHMIYGAVSIYGNGTTQILRDVSWMIVNNLYWAVPCFVMVTGALLLDPSRELSYKKLFQKYIFRVVFALFIFCILYTVYDMLMNGDGFSVAGLLNGLIDFITGKSWSHLWYLYMLVGLYLLMPFFKKITAKISTKELGYFLLVIVVFLSLIPILNLWNIKIGFGIPVATIYPFYLFFGYAVNRPEVHLSKWIAAICLVISTVALSVITWFRWKYPETQSCLEIFFNYSSIIVILQATSIFYLFAKERPVAENTAKEATADETEEKTVEKTETVAEEAAAIQEMVSEEEQKTKKENIIKKFILSFDSCSFGIYLVHMFLARYVLRYMGINPYDNIPVFLGLIVATIIVSYLVVWVLRKIPKVNKVL